MMTHPASIFVIVFTAINVLACMWLMWWTARGAPGETKTGHVWDGDLEEYNNPLPRWWLGLFIITVLFGAAYLVVFPGLGNFAGTSRWSAVGAYEAQVKEQRARFDERMASLRGKTLEQLAADPGAMSTAKNLFGANCSTCHGSDARGARGFPNLTDHDWLYGGENNTVYETIANGRHGMMPALGAVLGDTGVDEVASYVVSLSGHKAPADWVTPGKERFATICAGCHGADARGNPLVGAPNLTDSTWLYGGDFDTVRATIKNGRDNQMPAHAAILGESKVRLLAAYVLSLSNAEQQAANARSTATDGGTP
ncbi:MAG TPA: cytochrome-c oxidase, cbb3-type subunit III [Steroidobacteraceae bacterium]|nr:cytochrome-c oxidase, cbb3-type subunit III [Steroidobacteraceae bacterium]